LITAQKNEATKFLETIVSVQPRLSSGGAGMSTEEIVAEIAEGFLENLPKPMNRKASHPKTYEVTPDGGIISLGVFHGQELDRFNVLVIGIKTSLINLGKAIKGLVVMSAVMEDMFNSFLNQKLPGNWTGIAYPCLKPLNSWMADFILRMTFMNTWLTQSAPKSFWLPCFYFPQGFMTASMQVHARATKIPIDTLAFFSDITTCTDERVCDQPEAGVNVHGLIIQGGGWDVQKKHISESDKDVLFVMMPVIHLDPTLQKDLPDKVKGRYSCPLYKTSERKGTLSTTGHSTNFICYLTLGTDMEDLGHWVRRGIAMLCMLDD
jgi:dynein heavy chain